MGRNIFALSAAFAPFLALSLTSTNVSASENGVSSGNLVPKVVLLASASPSGDVDSSKIYGAELQGNWRFYSSFTIGFHGLLQKQEYGDFEEPRWGLGASLNYYHNIGSWLPYIGVKRTYYGGFGKTQDALDCLNCSDIEEEYSGGETFLSLGVVINNWTIQVDRRLSDNRSDWSENAYDPWGVGQSYDKSFEGIPDPEIVFHLGYSW